MATPQTDTISRYLAPRWDEPEDKKLGWIKEAEQDGIGFLKGNRAYQDIDKGIDIIAGLDEDPVPSSLSNVTSNRLKRQIREVVATLSDLRPLWGYVSDNTHYTAAAEVLNKLVYAWWLNTFADRSIRKALQWACISTGYLSPQWDPDYWHRGRGDIVLPVYGPRDVLPIQLGRDGDLQNAYAIIIQTEVPLFQLQQAFPLYQDKIKPDKDSPSWFYRTLRKAIPKFSSPVGGALFGEKETATTSGPMCDLFDIYIQDFSINRSGKPIRMGRAQTSWEYEVPFLDQEIPSGQTDSQNNVLYRRAKPEDCLMFPLRRRIRATRHCILEDGTSPWWHGKVPLVKFTVDDWPNEFLGFGLIRDVQSLQKSLNLHLRGMDDWSNKVCRPDVLYDPNIIAKSTVEKIDPRKAGNRIPVNFSMGKGYEVAEPFKLDPMVLTHIEGIKGEMDHLLAIRDMTNLAKVNQIPSGESIDKILEMAGPVVKDISRGMERSLRDLGEMVKTLFYQFYDAPRQVQFLGKGALTEENFYFEPGALIPSIIKSDLYMLEVIPQNLRRAKQAMNGTIFHITPNSLHQLQQMNRKLLMFQLWRDGRFPIDPETVGEAFDIPDFGTLDGMAEILKIDTKPFEGKGVVGKWLLFQQIQLAMQLTMQAAVAQTQMALGIQQQQAGLAAVGDQAVGEANQSSQGGGGKPNGQAHEGRPPSGNKPPHLESKDGGTRSTISES